MFETPQSIRDQIARRIHTGFANLPLREEETDALSAQLVASAIEVRPWSAHQLITVVERARQVITLDLSRPGQDVPSVVYYKPIAAAKVAIAALTGVLGSASGIVIGLVVIYGALTLGEVRTAASFAESLLFWVVFSSEGHRCPRADAKLQFATESQSIAEIEREDFEAAVPWTCGGTSGPASAAGRPARDRLHRNPKKLWVGPYYGAVQEQNPEVRNRHLLPNLCNQK
jgi:hypothetical protein